MPLPENEWYIEAPWGRIAIIAWGDCLNPPVLLCHGSLDTAATFRPLVQLLPENFYYIAMEFPGNGKSDWYPPGMMVSCYDLVYPIAVVVQHFRWEKFTFIGHSLGTVIGKLYNLSYPGKMAKVINLDPLTHLITLPSEDFSMWYHSYFSKFYEKFDKLNIPKDTGPVYKLEEAIENIKSKRGLTTEGAVATLDRMSEPVAAGTIRFTYDQRMKLVTPPPFSSEGIRKLFTSIPTPTLSLLAEKSIVNGLYLRTPFKLEESAYPHGKYRVRRVQGNHDVHFVHPERLAGYVSQFLLYGPEGLDSKHKL
ncbi:hypothetical protein ABMA28_012921 [Loxostege sticticalis]|uniref:AB hydrolase-1 domain-containing protein n=1 Tax=Loxostege sticticalis TaxID=481309 RepID=A0ABD0S318_LOXSC